MFILAQWSDVFIALGPSVRQHITGEHHGAKSSILLMVLERQPGVRDGDLMVSLEDGLQ